LKLQLLTSLPSRYTARLKLYTNGIIGAETVLVCAPYGPCRDWECRIS